jgi:glycerol-1-phosphate dehydrogenase [NAD(P)+]
LDQPVDCSSAYSRTHPITLRCCQISASAPANIQKPVEHAIHSAEDRGAWRVNSEPALDFLTIFGRNLVGEFPRFLPRPYLIVTMQDLWPLFRHQFDEDCRVYLVQSTEESALEADLAHIGSIKAVVGLGGGQALDVAKYFAWRCSLRLFQAPTSLSVDAVFGHRAAVRVDGRVRYVGWAVPEGIFIDYDVISGAPKAVNRAGIGDVLCFFSGVLDWRYAVKRGKAEVRWPYREDLVKVSLEKVEAVLANARAIRNVTDEGIRILADGLKWGGLSFLSSGWCPRHIEGFEHFFFYNLEFLTRKKFLHGQPVCLGVYIACVLHGERADEMLAAIYEIGVDIRPEAMGITWTDVAQTLRSLQAYVTTEKLWYGIANDAYIRPDFVDGLQRRLTETYGAWVGQ